MKGCYFVWFLFCLLTIHLITNLSCAKNKTETKKIEPTIVSGITMVFMHEQGRFTFLVNNSENKKLGQLSIETYRENVTILADLKDNESIRVEYFCGFNKNLPGQCRPIPTNFSNWNIHASQLTIHLRFANEIDGAGWNHGKFGSGQTSVVQ